MIMKNVDAAQMLMLPLFVLILLGAFRMVVEYNKSTSPTVVPEVVEYDKL